MFNDLGILALTVEIGSKHEDSQRFYPTKKAQLDSLRSCDDPIFWLVKKI